MIPLLINISNYYIQTDFIDDHDFQKFIDLIKGRSIENFNIDVNTEDKILTLSTCYSIEGDIKLVIHAKMIKQS